MNGISQTTTLPHSLARETSEDSEETIPPRQIGFSKWVKGYDGETTSNERRVWEGGSRANDPESDEETCMDISFGEILDVDYFPPPKLPTDDLIRLIEVTRERVQSDYRKILNHLQNLTAQPIPQLQPQPTSNEEYDLMTDDQSDLDHQRPSLEEAVSSWQTESDLWTMGHKECALVEPLLSTEGERIANREPRKALNSLLFILINGRPNIPLPKDPNFSSMMTAYRYFNLWQRDGVLKSVLTLLEQESQGPLKFHYRSLLKNFQEASNCRANPPSLRSLKLKFDEIVEFSFQGVNSWQWHLIEPLLVKNEELEHWSISDQQWALVQSLLSTKVEDITNQHPRKALDLIFSLLTGASSFASSNLTERKEAAEYLALWKKDGTLEKVLIRLIEVTQERERSEYRKMLSHLQNLTAQPIGQPQPQPTSNEECDLMTDDQSDLDHQGPSRRQVVRRREDGPKLWRISDREWRLVEPLFNKEVKATRIPRKGLNSLLFILINGDSTSLPKNPNFSAKQIAERYFLLWQANKVLEEVLSLLEKESQEPLQSYYRRLLKNLQKISNPKTGPLSIINFKRKFGQAGSGFQGVTGRQWILIDPLLNKKIIKSSRHHRRDLNSIFSVIMKGVPISRLPVTSDFSGSTNFHKYFAAWKEDGTLKKVVTRLIEEAQGTVQSDYRKVLDRL